MRGINPIPNRARGTGLARLGLNLQAAQNDVTHNEHYQRGVENCRPGRCTEGIEEREQADRQDPRNEWTSLIEKSLAEIMHEWPLALVERRGIHREPRLNKS